MTRTKIDPKVKLNLQQASRLIDNRLNRNRVIKYIETGNSAQSMSTTFQEACLTLVPQGPAQSQRVADTIWLQRIEMKINVTSANVDVFNLARLVLIRWKVSSSLALPTSADLFNNFGTNVVHSFLNFERRENYSISLDTTLNLTGVAASPTNTSQHWLNLTHNMGNQLVQFDPAATTATDHIFFGWFSDSAAIPFPVLNYNFRIWYYDE
jgi:hypothetical protein